ncbi:MULTISPECIES: helix-turn-helix transcriptional regulator [unclassified Colwellia]|uniref:helix-turn-helix transcriptional regulator n=1 Tax=unclassified Colwellia TaxID=196834 RepID=UPI0015F6C01B|nr:MULTISPECIES: AlpA family phage regulatory protein [unclassified Colwellia]MBA6234067.1 AlpA family phage regulatory protein [Colwellia sp. MB02u-7]MBA6238011.1 AlpA family phage regulatory protein [Colwellia sp. MB02u-11]MBA6300741.1 AlpA family phage regulatory protein [Colwellia sp. MB3u-22]MBA6311360.1 AlpA family phage regulatory protein [Colwellia sp. MB3u-64]
MALTRTENKPLRIIRINEVLQRQGLPKSTFYEKVKMQLMTAPVSLGARSVGWPEHEVDEINKALIGGANAEQIRTLVIKLTKQRQQLMCD